MYTTYKQVSASVPGSPHGLYEERVIINCSDQPVGMIDKYGNKYVIQPDNNRDSGGEIKIHIRSGVGNEVTKRSNVMDTILCVVPETNLLSDSVYVKEADVVFCHRKNLEYCQHPNKSFSYKEGLKWIYTELTNQKRNNPKTPTVKVLANDPSAKINFVYIHILDVICEIPVTHYPTVDDGVTLIFPLDGLVVKYIPFKEIIESNGHVKMPFVDCFMGLSRESIRNAMDIAYDAQRIYTQTQFNDLNKENDKKVNAAVKQVETSLAQKHKLATALLENKVSELNLEVGRLNQELESYKRMINSSNNYLNAVERQMSHHEKKMDNESKKLGFFVTTMKLIVPLVGGIMLQKYIGSAAAAAAK